MEIAGIGLPAGIRGGIGMASLIFGALVAMPAPAVSGPADVILAVRPAGRQFDECIKGFTEELGADIGLTQVLMDSDFGPDHLLRALDSLNPRALLLLDNRAISVYRAVITQRKQPPSPPLPVLATMGVFVARSAAGLPNTASIAYEVPIVISVVNLRAVWPVPIKKLGVVCREEMAEVIDKDLDYCYYEEIQPTVRMVRMGAQGADLAGQLRISLQEIFSQGVDALWVPNDIALLKPRLLRTIWRPLLRKYRIPLIVGVESLVSPESDFGVFSVVPDHVSLGAQAAALILTARDRGWTFDAGTMEMPVSINKIINLRKAQTLVPLDGINLISVDKALK